MVSREEWAARQKIARREQHKAYNASAKGKARKRRYYDKLRAQRSEGEA